MSVDRIEDAGAMPGTMGSVLRASGLRSVVMRCWLTIDGSFVAVMLMCFDTAGHAAQVLAPDRLKRLEAVGASGFADIPGVPAGQTFTASTAGDDTPKLLAFGSRATTLFVVLGPATPSFDVTAIDEYAKRQYDRL